MKVVDIALSSKSSPSNFFAGDCLEFLRVCFIDIFDTVIAKVVLVIAFVNVIGLTLLQTYYSMYYLDAVHFLKYAPVYFGRFYVSLHNTINLLWINPILQLMVSISFILFYKNILYKYFQKVPKWKLDAVSKQDKSKIAKEALYVTLFCCLAIIVGVSTGVLYLIPSEEDHEIFFIMTWFEENLLEWADILSLFHRLSFPFASFLMQTPCIQLCYTLSHLQYQMKIFIRLVENLNTGYEDTDLDQLIFNEDHHKEIKRRLIFCIKRHTEIIVTGQNILRAGKLFVFLFSISGGVLGISMLMLIFFVRMSCKHLLCQQFLVVASRPSDVHLHTFGFTDLCGSVDIRHVYYSRTTYRRHCRFYT
jgi:hypothetical protein